MNGQGLMDWLLDLLPLSASRLALLGITIFAYWITRWLYRRCGGHPMLIPVLSGSVLVIVLLLWLDVPYAQYAKANGLLQFLMGPATVALAIPLYSELHQLRRMWRPLLIALGAGSVVAIVSAVGIAWLFGGSIPMLMSLAPKSATMPIAMPASELLGGVASLTGVACAITGISAVVMARPLYRLVGSDDPVVQGFSMGLTAHAIGTARMIQENPQAAASSALAMGLNGMLTAALIPFLPWLLGLL